MRYTSLSFIKIQLSITMGRAISKVCQQLCRDSKKTQKRSLKREQERQQKLSMNNRKSEPERKQFKVTEMKYNNRQKQQKKNKESFSWNKFENEEIQTYPKKIDNSYKEELVSQVKRQRVNRYPEKDDEDRLKYDYVSFQFPKKVESMMESKKESQVQVQRKIQETRRINRYSEKEDEDISKYDSVKSRLEQKVEPLIETKKRPQVDVREKEQESKKINRYSEKDDIDVLKYGYANSRLEQKVEPMRETKQRSQVQVQKNQETRKINLYSKKDGQNRSKYDYVNSRLPQKVQSLIETKKRSQVDVREKEQESKKINRYSEKDDEDVLKYGYANSRLEQKVEPLIETLKRPQVDLREKKQESKKISRYSEKDDQDVLKYGFENLISIQKVQSMKDIKQGEQDNESLSLKQAVEQFDQNETFNYFFTFNELKKRLYSLNIGKPTYLSSACPPFLQKELTQMKQCKEGGFHFYYFNDCKHNQKDSNLRRFLRKVTLYFQCNNNNCSYFRNKGKRKTWFSIYGLAFITYYFERSEEVFRRQVARERDRRFYYDQDGSDGYQKSFGSKLDRSKKYFLHYSMYFYRQECKDCKDYAQGQICQPQMTVVSQMFCFCIAKILITEKDPTKKPERNRKADEIQYVPPAPTTHKKELCEACQRGKCKIIKMEKYRI